MILLDEELRASEQPHIFDNTMRQLCHSCLRKTYWFLRGYDYASKPAYFIAGDAWHQALGDWYLFQREDFFPKTANFEDPQLIFTVGLCLSKLRAVWTASGHEGDGKLNTLENLESMFKRYVNVYPFEHWKLVELGAELGFVWPLAGTDYSIAGSIDGYIEWPSYGVLALEHKTSGTYLTDAFMQQWRLSTQVKTYIWYLNQLVGEGVYGALINCVTKNIPTSRSKWTTPWAARELVQLSSKELADFVEDFKWDIEIFEKAWRLWRWPMARNPIECVGGIGRAPCLFRPLCLQSDADFRDLNPLQFSNIADRGAKWEPWKRGGFEP